MVVSGVFSTILEEYRTASSSGRPGTLAGTLDAVRSADSRAPRVGTLEGFDDAQHASFQRAANPGTLDDAPARHLSTRINFNA